MLRSANLPLPDISVQPALKARLRQGHPWVYRNQVQGEVDLPSGTWVRLHCERFEAVGLWDASSPIAIRIFDRQSVPDAAWVSRCIQAAWELRDELCTSNTNAYRWIYGEGDGLPGMVVDRYGDYAIVQTYADSLDLLVPLVVQALRTCDRSLRGIVQRTGTLASAPSEAGNAPVAQDQITLRALWGERPPADLVVQEYGLFFRANLYAGQKTGLFLDQRENRRMVEHWSSGRSVLNCFAYTGGFSLYALRGGAVDLVSCDIAAEVADDARRNFELNGFDPQQFPFLIEDCFELLARFGRQNRQFDMVILDPPSFARAKSSRYAALRAYTRLNTLALQCVRPGGLLVTSSCTSQVSPEAFRDILADAAAQARRRLQIVHEAGQPADHPVPAGFLEGRYLKFVIARAL